MSASCRIRRCPQREVIGQDEAVIASEDPAAAPASHLSPPHRQLPSPRLLLGAGKTSWQLAIGFARRRAEHGAHDTTEQRSSSAVRDRRASDTSAGRRGRLLTEAVRRNLAASCQFDEAESAHPRRSQQVLAAGKLTTAASPTVRGRTVTSRTPSSIPDRPRQSDIVLNDGAAPRRGFQRARMPASRSIRCRRAISVPNLPKHPDEIVHLRNYQGRDPADRICSSKIRAKRRMRASNCRRHHGSQAIIIDDSVHGARPIKRLHAEPQRPSSQIFGSWFCLDGDHAGDGPSSAETAISLPILSFPDRNVALTGRVEYDIIGVE